MPLQHRSKALDAFTLRMVCSNNRRRFNCCIEQNKFTLVFYCQGTNNVCITNLEMIRPKYLWTDVLFNRFLTDGIVHQQKSLNLNLVLLHHQTVYTMTMLLDCKVIKTMSFFLLKTRFES